MDSSDYIKIGGAAVLAIIIGVIVYMLIPENSPKLTFYNEGTEITSGEVFIDGESIGVLDDTGFVNLPNKYCTEKHTIQLSVGKDYELDLFPGDCKYKSLKFTVSDKTETVEKIPEKIKFNFFIQENKKSLQGKLFFDNSSAGFTTGLVEVERTKCSQINRITLVVSEINLTWNNSPEKCMDKDAIEFPIQESQLK